MPSTKPPNGPTGGYFDLLPSPDPSQFSFRVREDAKDFQPTLLPTYGTRYAAANWLKTKPRVTFEGFKDYVYTHCERTDQYLWFYFGKNKTPAQRSTPFRTFYDTRGYVWPAVLEDVYIVQSTTFVQSTYNGTATVTSPSLFPRYRYRPSVSVSSVIKVEQFLAETPWSEQELTHEQPVPTDVNASYLGVSVDFPRCLHGDITFRELVPGASIVSGVGMVTPPLGRDPTRMIFPATNFTDWSPFIIEDKQQPTNGLWLRERVTIYPPPQPETTFQ
jgi:hypothetical protein